MGCNFYTLDGIHIGKRSAAGFYCWDCGITLCKEGEKGVHHSGNEWYDKCPKCGREPATESLTDSATGRELGFNGEPFGPKTGVKSCSSFTWACVPSAMFGKWFVKDEYGKWYTKKGFGRILEECPIEYTDVIGRYFS